MRAMLTVLFHMVLSLLILFITPLRAYPQIFDVKILPNRVYPGVISKLIIKEKVHSVRLLSIRYKGQDIPFIEENGTYWCLLGIGLDETPGKRLISLIYGIDDHNIKEDVESVAFTIYRKDYPKEFLKVSKKMVEFPKPILKRVLDDQNAIRSAVSKIEFEKYFDGPFLKPVKGAVKSTFGLRRFFNNKPRSPHSGVDLAVPKGTPVLACNNGKVVLVRDCYLSGMTVVIDHGLGLYSLYAHLGNVFVSPGQLVKKGEKIALSGMSGRATGPHLHWGISLYGKRLDPLALLKIF